MIANGYTEAAKTSQLISLSSRIYSFLTRFLVAYNIFLCYNEIRNIFSYVNMREIDTLNAKLLLATTCCHVLSVSYLVVMMWKENQLAVTLQKLLMRLSKRRRILKRKGWVIWPTKWNYKKCKILVKIKAKQREKLKAGLN